MSTLSELKAKVAAIESDVPDYVTAFKAHMKQRGAEIASSGPFVQGDDALAILAIRDLLLIDPGLLAVHRSLLHKLSGRCARVFAEVHAAADIANKRYLGVVSLQREFEAQVAEATKRKVEFSPALQELFKVTTVGCQAVLSSFCVFQAYRARYVWLHDRSGEDADRAIAAAKREVEDISDWFYGLRTCVVGLCVKSKIAAGWLLRLKDEQAAVES